MSIAVMSRVWSKSQHKGNALLLLLAIADNADDGGWCWPGIEYLAKKVKVTPQSIIRITRKLEQSLELTVLHNRRTGNKYVVRLGMTNDELVNVLRKKAPYLSGEQITNILLHNASVTSEVTDNVSSEVTPVLDESSLTVNEPSHVATATPAPADAKDEAVPVTICRQCDKWGYREEFDSYGLCKTCTPADAKQPKPCEACGEPTTSWTTANGWCESCRNGLTFGELPADAKDEPQLPANVIAEIRESLSKSPCAVCGKLEATTADMTDIHNTCTCEQEATLTQTFGERPQRAPQKQVEHWTVQAGKAWAQWGAESDEFQRQLQRFGDSGLVVQELGYKLEEATGLKPLWGTPKKVKWWSSGLWELYEEAGCSISVAIEAVRALKSTKLPNGERMTTASPYSFVNTARALAADRAQKPERIIIR